MRTFIIISALFSLTTLRSQNFTEMVKAIAQDREADDRFGYAVAIDGNWAAIGSYGDDFGPVDPNMGSVYMFEQQGLNNWVFVQKITASDQGDYDRFGWAVDIHGDFLVVGSYGEDEDTSGGNTLSKAGSAYFYKNINGTWAEMQKVVASDRDEDDEFGWAVAVYDSTAMIGAHIEDHDELGGNFMYHSGSVYAFELGTDNIWTETQKIVPEDRWVDMNYPNGYSGEDLADQFGGTVDIWGDWMIVGAHHHDYATVGPLSGALWSSGAAYIFERTGGIWTEVQKIQNFDRESWDRFGYDVAIDSNIIAVSAYSEDEVEDGVSDPLTNPGSVYIWERDAGGTWNAVQKIVPLDRSSGDHFGYSLHIDDTLMVIGCHSDDHDEFGSDVKDDAGSAYIFERNGGTWTQFQKIDASDRVTGDDLGVSVGVSGHTVLVGAQFQDFNDVGLDSVSDAGAAYFYSNFICSGADTTVDVNICDGDSYSIGGNTYSVSGTYSDVLLSVSGCDSTVFTNLTVDTEILTDIYPTMCDGGIYYYQGVGITIPGNYSYLFTAENGCDSTVILHLTMDPPITSEQWVSVCWGESYSIGTSTHSSSGTYADVVSATNFCDSTITTHLTVELPLDVSISQTNNVLTANENADTYQWFNCENDQIIMGATSQSFHATAIGQYGVIITKNGCTDTSSCIYVSQLGHIEDHLLDQAISIFPNPSCGQFTIQIDQPFSEAHISVYNAEGKLIASQWLQTSSTTFENLPAGIYIVEIQNKSAIIRKRLVVQ